MVGVDDSWVATVGRPSQLAFALPGVVCALLGCSWAVSPIHLSFRTCPRTQTATATKKIPRLREAIESKRSCRTLTCHFIFRLHASHPVSNTLVAMQSHALSWHTALELDLAHSLGACHADKPRVRVQHPGRCRRVPGRLASQLLRFLPPLISL